ncbi:MAG: tRNA 2-thiouridine(34) synthase MnmA [Candidatus Eisenbacteria bacterium]|uniref:tRNA-specific 2-thiouridylase MnmA n=1 Tax=Eiseniibacteriota bacterium TaxID=2212470 RepID=A0A7Y2E8X1_UNCEI|nr:tRNA 2-thiouridine(34) synthase MnmA [Candidatus Eisenbacteria bacterium]
MSGGVDSAVAAALLAREGHEVVGATLKLWCYGGEKASARSCCSLKDIEDARNTASRIGIKHYVLDEEADFDRDVIDPFVNSYLDGETPNPCVRCNTHLKFGGLLNRAKKMGFDAVATGHYAQISQEADGPVLRRGKDAGKDQSYVLWGLTRADLSFARFPVGSYSKDEIRTIAEEIDLNVAQKIDSQDICFVQGGAYSDFVKQRAGDAPQAQPGNIVDLDGVVLGRHRGVIHYTVGQRRGLGLAGDAPIYVVAIDAEQNEVIVGPESALLETDMVLREVNWVSMAPPASPFSTHTKIRYRAPGMPSLFTPKENGWAHVKFEEPQRAISPGQSAVFYRDDVVLGGAVIHSGAPVVSEASPVVTHTETL